MKSEIEIHEEFTMRIPTKSMDTLKMLYLVFTVQTLTNLRDAKGHKIKAAYTYLDLSSLCKHISFIHSFIYNNNYLYSFLNWIVWSTTTLRFQLNVDY